MRVDIGGNEMNRKWFLHVGGIATTAFLTMKWLVFPAPQEYAACFCHIVHSARDQSTTKTGLINKIAAPSRIWCFGAATNPGPFSAGNFEFFLFSGNPTCHKIQIASVRTLVLLTVVLAIATTLYALVYVALRALARAIT